MKRLYVLAIATIVILICLGINSSRAFVWESNLSYAYRSDNLLRLHILANSNSPEDQYLKRQIRDLIVHETSRIFRDLDTLDDAIAVTNSQLPTLQKKIEEFLQTKGKNLQVRLEIGTFDFPTRTYGNVVLPAGDYKALQVILGEGDGNNWWCVLFPPLCLDNEDNFIEDDKQIPALAMVRDKDVTIEYRFKLFDTLSETPSWVKSNYLGILRMAVMGSNGAILPQREGELIMK